MAVRTVTIPLTFEAASPEQTNDEHNLSLSEKYIRSTFSEPKRVQYVINKLVPVPPGTRLYNSKQSYPYNPRDEEREHQEFKSLGDAVKTSRSPAKDSDKWIDRAMKRNVELLSLVERLRPLSNKRSFSSHIYKKYSKFSSVNNAQTPISTQDASADDKKEKNILDFSDRVSTTEIRDVLPREQLLQIVHEYLSAHKYHKTIETLNKESGVIYNGYSLEKMSRNQSITADMPTPTRSTVLKTLMQMAVNDPEKPLALPTNDLENLEVDVEVQTASIYSHLEEEYSADLKRGFWDEILNTDESENAEYSTDGSLKAASLNRLVEKITDHKKPDAMILKTFLTTYRSFTVPEVFLAKLTERYNVPERPPANMNISQDEWENNKKQIEIRSGNVLVQWIEDFFDLDWNHQMIKSLTTFIEDELFKNDKNRKLGKQILTRLDRKLRGKVQGEFAQSSSVNVNPPITPRNLFMPNFDLFDICDLELARQLTLREHELYRAIEPSELLNQAWSKEKLKHRAPNVQACTDSFNIVSSWVANSILEIDDLRERKERLQRFIKIARILLDFNNFSSVLVIVSGLQNASVYRLKKTWADLGNLQNDFQLCVDTMRSDRSFHDYRKKLINATPPCVPYLGILLTDLTFVEDGNPDSVNTSDGRKLINWKKKKLVHEVISNIKQYQFDRYDFQPVYQIQKLLEKTFKSIQEQSDAVMYKRSLHLEPREQQQ
ncbi:gefJ [Acrasis kona]|uniref:GefJ n=1 Tax=Acrasis kona TaxID=1008807 RepID=A0AAW2YV38_9EUKA